MKSWVKRCHFVFIVTLLATLPLPVDGRAETRLVTGEYPPYSSRHLPKGGITTELIKRVFEEMNEPVLIDYLPWKRGYEQARKGAFLATFPYLRIGDRQNDFYFSDPILVWESKIYAERNSQIEFKNWNDLAGYTQCLPLGNAGHPSLDRMYQKGIISRVHPVSCWNMLLRGRADFIIEDKEVAKSELLITLGDQKDQIIPLGKTVSFDFGHLIFSKQHPRALELVEKFNVTLKKLIENGEIRNYRRFAP